MNTISLKLPKPLLDRLESEAASRRQSKSALIRDCLTDVLLRRPKGGKLTCTDVAGHLVGSLRGPRDLSSRVDHHLELAIKKERACERKHYR